MGYFKKGTKGYFNKGIQRDIPKSDQRDISIREFKGIFQKGKTNGIFQKEN